MSWAGLSRVGDQELLDALCALLVRGRRNDAAVLAHIGEVDARGLYLPAGYPSMHLYCVSVLHMSEDAAFKRITAARAARRFPALLRAVSEGRLHLSAVCMLAAHFTDENFEELVAAATHRTKRQIELMLVARAPRRDVPERLSPLGSDGTGLAPQLAPGRVEAGEDADGPVTTRTTPLAPERYALQLTIDEATHQKLMRAQALLRHRVPSGDLAEVIDRALDSLLAVLVRDRFAITEKPRAVRADPEPAGRGIPADVRRAVHQRDGEQCTFVSADGTRCPERGFLELDHVDPVALGGTSTAANVRVLCAAHNRYEAERRLGREYVEARRRERRAAVARRSPIPPAREVARDDARPLEDQAFEALRAMGVKPAEARDAVARSARAAAATVEERVVAALRALRTTYASRCAESTAHWYRWPWPSTPRGGVVARVAERSRTRAPPAAGAGHAR
jgi:hypothetical protein